MDDCAPVVRARLTNAFKELRKRGYFARQRWQCCQSCGWDAIPDKDAKKAVFYHQQDFEIFQRPVGDRRLNLAWAGKLEEVCHVLVEAGLNVVVPLNEAKRIQVMVDRLPEGTVVGVPSKDRNLLIEAAHLYVGINLSELSAPESGVLRLLEKGLGLQKITAHDDEIVGFKEENKGG